MEYLSSTDEGWNTSWFVEPVNELDLCGICGEVLRDAMETPCGHCFCDTCLQSWLEKKLSCPMDQRGTTYNVCHAMVRDRRRILQLTVFCPRKSEGCQEKMALSSLEQHLKTCCSLIEGTKSQRVGESSGITNGLTGPNDATKDKSSVSSDEVPNWDSPREPNAQWDPSSPVAVHLHHSPAFSFPTPSVFAERNDNAEQKIVEDEDAKLARSLQLQELALARQSRLQSSQTSTSTSDRKNKNSRVEITGGTNCTSDAQLARRLQKEEEERAFQNMQARQREMKRGLVEANYAIDAKKSKQTGQNSQGQPKRWSIKQPTTTSSSVKLTSEKLADKSSKRTRRNENRIGRQPNSDRNERKRHPRPREQGIALTNFSAEEISDHENVIEYEYEFVPVTSRKTCCGVTDRACYCVCFLMLASALTFGISVAHFGWAETISIFS